MVNLKRIRQILLCFHLESEDFLLIWEGLGFLRERVRDKLFWQVKRNTSNTEIAIYFTYSFFKLQMFITFHYPLGTKIFRICIHLQGTRDPGGSRIQAIVDLGSRVLRAPDPVYCGPRIHYCRSGSRLLRTPDPGAIADPRTKSIANPGSMLLQARIQAIADPGSRLLRTPDRG